MKEIFIEGLTLPETYHKALQTLYYAGEIADCSDYNQQQRECSMTLYVKEPIKEPRISKLWIGGHADLYQYEKEILDGILDFRIGHGWNYTYHNRIMEQYSFVLQELKRNPSSRRTVIDVRDWKYDSQEGNTSPACLQNIQYFIRNNKLDCCVLFRSNDLPEAVFMNMWALIRLQEKIAKELRIEIGTYTHRSNSMHCYEKDFKLLEGFAKNLTKFMNVPNYYTLEYENFYKELMEETQQELDAKIKQLKNNMEANKNG
jgi:thymidylate synthase